MGVGRGRAVVTLAPLDFKNFSTKGCFLSFQWEKTNFTTFGTPIEKFWKNTLVAPLEKIVPTPMTLTMHFSNLWKHCYRLMLFFTQYQTTWLTAMSSVTVLLHYPPSCLCSTITYRGPIQWFQTNLEKHQKTYSYNNNTESLCCTPKKTYLYNKNTESLCYSSLFQIFFCIANINAICRRTCAINTIPDKQKANLDHSDGNMVIANVFMYCGKRAALGFPKCWNSVCIYLCIMDSSCIGELSFSKLHIIKNYLRSSIGQKLSILSLMSMEHEILGDTDLETIINDFACKKCGVMELFVADFFQKAHWQSNRDQGHFNKFVTKYSSQSNAFTITVYCADVTISCEVLVVIVRVSVADLTTRCCPPDHWTVNRCNYCKAPITKLQSSSTAQVAFAWY